ncbi:MAG: nucleoside 2-deoxyribosyltransferase domain-containing protein [Moraxellaceae bacterium]|nr:nucleoside 2-deoxyribosyltransferase domain-containing protein [Moraxellaceae bacterium]
MNAVKLLNDHHRAIQVKSPMSFRHVAGKTVFLAGTIDEGKSIDWQAFLVSQLDDLEVVILNPRREVWDSSRGVETTYLKEQVDWELDALEKANYIFMYFAPNSYAPISLLELGLYAKSGKLIVVCPEGYWKKGNVDIVAKKFAIPLFDDISIGVKHLRSLICQI